MYVSLGLSELIIKITEIYVGKKHTKTEDLICVIC